MSEIVISLPTTLVIDTDILSASIWNMIFWYFFYGLLINGIGFTRDNDWNFNKPILSIAIYYTASILWLPFVLNTIVRDKFSDHWGWDIYG